MAAASTVVVLGGGITGVCLAYYLLQLDPSLDVTVRADLRSRLSTQIVDNSGIAVRSSMPSPL